MKHHRQLRICLVAAVVSVAILSHGRPAFGSTVVSMNVATMADHSAQVIIADIGETKAYRAENPRRIETSVELRNIVYLKGDGAFAPSARTLIVPGGKIGEQQMRICCAPEFKAGERWILFLLPAYKTFPTVGIGLGAFRLVEDAAGVARVYQHGGLPVSGVNDETWIEYASAPRSHVHGQLAGASSNMRVADRSNETLTKTMTFDAFRDAIQPTLDKSRSFDLTSPAGQRVLVTYRPVPIRTAAGATASADSSHPARPFRTPPEATPKVQRGDAGTDPAVTERASSAKASKPGSQREAPTSDKSEAWR